MSRFTLIHKPPINPNGACCRSATKFFYVLYDPLNTSRWLNCLQPEIPTGLYFTTFAPGLMSADMGVNVLMEMFKVNVNRNRNMDRTDWGCLFLLPQDIEKNLVETAV